MNVVIHKDSHVDHALTQEQLAYVLAELNKEEPTGLIIRNLTLPAHLGTLPCGLYGPLAGDPPIKEEEVFFQARGNRPYLSRLIRRPLRPSRQVVAIAGPYEGQATVLYTVYGGPLALQEPGEPGCRDKEASQRFWAEHALSSEQK